MNIYFHISASARDEENANETEESLQNMFLQLGNLELLRRAEASASPY